MTPFNYKWVTKWSSHYILCSFLCSSVVISRSEVMSSVSFGFRIKLSFNLFQFKVEQNSYLPNKYKCKENLGILNLFVCVCIVWISREMQICKTWHKPAGLNQDCNTHVMPGNKRTLKVFSYSSQRSSLTVQFPFRSSQLTLMESMEILHSKGQVSALYINIRISSEFLNKIK